MEIFKLNSNCWWYLLYPWKCRIFQQFRDILNDECQINFITSPVSSVVIPGNIHTDWYFPVNTMERGKSMHYVWWILKHAVWKLSKTKWVMKRILIATTTLKHLLGSRYTTDFVSACIDLFIFVKLRQAKAPALLTGLVSLDITLSCLPVWLLAKMGISGPSRWS